MKVVFASSRPAAEEWLERHCPWIAGMSQRIERPKRADIDRETILIGSWPVHLIGGCAEYWTIEFERRSRAADLSADAMEAHGAHLKRYHLLGHDHLGLLVKALTGQETPLAEASEIGAQAIQRIKGGIVP